MGVSVPSGATTEGEPAPPIRSFVDSLRSAFGPVAVLLRSLEVDTRMLGMVGALAVIWIAFDIVSGGTFLSPRNLWNLSVQSASIGIMATGMVLIIVSRNIDLSVGSMLGFLGYTMAMVQAVWIPNALGLGFEQPYTWLVTLVIGVLLGALIRGLQGFIVAVGGAASCSEPCGSPTAIPFLSTWRSRSRRRRESRCRRAAFQPESRSRS